MKKTLSKLLKHFIFLFVVLANASIQAENALSTKHLEKVVIGAGCFWGVEVLFEEMNGVNKVISGYSGGHTNNPTYEQVCTGETGHIEVVKIDYDSSVVTFSELLDKFFFIHDPTSVNRQGPDVGTQYRSVIFYNSDEEKEIAEKKIKEINESGEYDKEVATDLRESVEFYEAEEYHQDFVEKNGKICYHQLYVENKQSSKN